MGKRIVLRAAAPHPLLVENDSRYAAILSGGHGVPSSVSEMGSVAVAAMIGWWNDCIGHNGAKLSDCLVDVDDLVGVLQRFKKAVAADHSLIRFDGRDGSPTCAVCGGHDPGNTAGGITVGSVESAQEHAVGIGDYVCRDCWRHPEDFDDGPE